MNSEPAQAEAARRVMAAFKTACQRFEPLGRGRRLMLGCSAGGDSMCLLDLAARAALEQGWKLALAHLDHRQRPESTLEAAFVSQQAAEREIPFFSEALEGDPNRRGALSEEAMRQARLDFFGRQCDRWNADALLLAHQADDRAETFLIRLLAGSGPRGLSAIRPVERLRGLTIVRPLVGARRDDLRAYLRRQGRAWHDDPTNQGDATKRAWIRNTLMPMIEAYLESDPTGRIARASELIAEEAGALNDASEHLLAELTQPGPPPATSTLDLTTRAWVDSGPALRRQLLRLWLQKLRSSPYPAGFAATEAVLDFAQKIQPGAELRTVEHIHLIHCKHRLAAYAPEVEKTERQRSAAQLTPPSHGALKRRRRQTQS